MVVRSFTLARLRPSTDDAANVVVGSLGAFLVGRSFPDVVNNIETGFRSRVVA